MPSDPCPDPVVVRMEMLAAYLGSILFYGQAMNTHKECLICRGSKLSRIEPYYSQCGLIKCAACGFVFMEKVPSEEELTRHYGTYAYSSENYLSPVTIKRYHSILDEFEKYRKTNKILDVGCGRGWFLQEAKKRNWSVHGTEYSEAAIELCRTSGIEMTPGQLTTGSFEPGGFDVITSFEVIEHINNPMEELGHVHEFLRKGGLFYCTTPNFNSILRYYLKTAYNIIGYPEHLSYYTRRTLDLAMRNAGFTGLKVLSTGISITRIKTSKNMSNEKFVSAASSDELLRQMIDGKWYLTCMKKAVDHLLTALGLGMTLKGYYMKK